MGATFVITLREAFEAALLLGIVYTYLDKIGRRAQSHYVTTGALAGVVASIVLGVLVNVLSGPLLDLGPDLIGIAVLLVAVIVLTWHGWWMRQHARAIKGNVQRRLDEASQTSRLWIVAVIAFTACLPRGRRDRALHVGAPLPGERVGDERRGGRGARDRDGRAPRVADLPRRPARQPAPGFRRHLDTPAPGRRGLLGTAIGKLQTLGFLPATSVAWDTSWLLDDHGAVGGFLTGLVGYRAQPSTLEVAAVRALCRRRGLAAVRRRGARPTVASRPMRERDTVAMAGKKPLTPR